MAIDASSLEVADRAGRLSPAEAIDALHILVANHGFRNDALEWLEYPKVRTFTRTQANPVTCCPDCGDTPKYRALGQYVYYSTLIRLRECGRCGLVWSDAAIDSTVLRAHFETAYKDQQYFENERADIFVQIVQMLTERVPHAGRVLDAGGGMGHLLMMLRRVRPDIDCTLLDISARSVEYARDKFALEAMCGTLQDVQDGPYDAVVCADVIYYEEDIRACWAALEQLSDTIIIRVPDKLRLIRARQKLFEIRHGKRARQLQDTIPGFNPEHRYVLSRDYLTTRLQTMGYRTHIVPSVTRSKPGVLGAPLNWMSALARRCGLSSAMVVVAERPPQA